MLLNVQLSKNITKCLLFIIIHISCTHFEINLFYFHNMKRKQTMEHQPNPACEQTNSKQEQNQVTSNSN